MVFQPEGNQPFVLIIRPSKIAGRRHYLSIKHSGEYKPEFISTLYEARTPNGIYNFEHKGVRYEIAPEGQNKVVIFQVRKGVTFE
jgi:hypothetical protein